MRVARLMLTVVLGSCAVESVQPLTPLGGSRADPALVGTWVSKGGETKQREMTITATGPVMRLTVEPDTGDEKGEEKGSFEGHVSALADFKVLNLRLREGDEVGGGYVFVRYQLTGDTLELWLPNETAVKAALKAGTLKGRRTQYGGTTIDDTPARMTRFFTEGKREERFEPFATFTRKR